MDRKLLLLRRHRFSDGLTKEEIESKANDCELMELATDQSLHQAGDPIDSLFLIVLGRFRQTVQDQACKEVLRDFCAGVCNSARSPPPSRSP